MKKLINTLSILLTSVFIYAQDFTFTHQYELDAFGIQGHSKVNSIVIKGDTTQSIADRILDLSPLYGLDSIILSISFQNAYITDVSTLKSIKYIRFITLWNCHEIQMADFKDYKNLGSIYIEKCNNLIEIKNPSSSFLIGYTLKELDNLAQVPHIAFANPYTTSNNAQIDIQFLSKLKSLNFSVNQDSSIYAIIENNPLLETVSMSFIQTNKPWPQKYSDFMNNSKWKRNFKILNNNKLETISATNNYIGLTRLSIKDNPELKDLCIFKPSLLHLKELRDNDVPQNLKNSLVSNNGTGAANFDEVLAKDCLAMTPEEFDNVDKETNNNLYAYPNPYTGGALQLNGVKTGSQIVLYDIVGKEVYRTQYTGTAISLPQVNKGLYLIEAKNLKGHREYVKLYID
jgi:hypothetical protein